jgi:hypothetical protein
MRVIAELFAKWLQWVDIEQVSSILDISHFYIKIHHGFRVASPDGRTAQWPWF